MGIRPTRRGAVGFITILVGLIVLGFARRHYADDPYLPATPEETAHEAER